MRRTTRLLLYYLVCKKRGRRSGGKRHRSIHLRNGLLRQMLLQRMLTRHQEEAYWRQVRRRRWWVRPILQDHDVFGAWARLIPVMREEDPEEFYNFHATSVEDFDKLLHLCSPYLTKVSLRSPICAGERLSITLRYLASGDSMVSLKYLYLVSTASISNIIRETCYVIWFCLKDSVFEPFNTEIWYKNAAEFESMWNFTHAVGALDGKHIIMQALPDSGSENFNYKYSHSLVLMAACDAKLKFMSVDIGAPGSINDASVLSKTQFGKMLYGGKLGLPPPSCPEGSTSALPFVFLADGIFPLLTNMMVPYEGRFLSPDKTIYNYRLSRARHTVENAFGVLTTKFRALRGTINACRTTIKGVVLAAVALHNFHLMNEEFIPPKNRRYIPPKYVDHCDPRGKLVPGRWRREDKGLRRSIFQKLQKATVGEVGDPKEVREAFNDYFIQHPVPWQWKTLPHNGLYL